MAERICHLRLARETGGPGFSAGLINEKGGRRSDRLDFPKVRKL
jgi:hypothetical protein